MALSISERMTAVHSIAVEEDDALLDGPEVQMLALAGRDREDPSKLSPEGVDYLVNIFNADETQFKGGARRDLQGILLGEAGLTPAKLRVVEPDPVRVEYVAGTSTKFYVLEVQDRSLRITYGKLGTPGKELVKPFDTPEAAVAEYAKRLKEKLAEGYQRPDAISTSAPVSTIVSSKSMVSEISWDDLEELIDAEYGISYDIVPNEEWSNDSQHSFEVTSDLSEWEEGELAEFMAEENPSYALGVLMNDLCRRGKLEPGNYLVTVCW